MTTDNKVTELGFRPVGNSEKYYRKGDDIWLRQYEGNGQMSWALTNKGIKVFTDVDIDKVLDYVKTNKL